MTGIQVFAFIALPALIVLGAGIVLFVFEARHPRRSPEPDLFDPPPRRRALANSDGLGRSSKSSR